MAVTLFEEVGRGTYEFVKKDLVDKACVQLGDQRDEEVVQKGSPFAWGILHRERADFSRTSHQLQFLDLSE